MYDYLTNGSTAAQRRANVSHYINVDGQDQNPGVPTLAVWAGRGTPGRHMDGAQNVTIPNQTHVQTCTSAESFRAYYRFLTGHKPAHDIVRQSGSIRVAGKALDFPQNTGLQGATVRVWPLNANGASDHGGATRVARDHRRLGGGWRLGAGERPGRQAVRVHGRAVRAAEAPHLLRAVREKRLHPPSARVPGDRELRRQPPRQHVRSSTSGTRSCGATKAPRTTNCGSTASTSARRCCVRSASRSTPSSPSTATATGRLT